MTTNPNSVPEPSGMPGIRPDGSITRVPMLLPRCTPNWSALMRNAMMPATIALSMIVEMTSLTPRVTLRIAGTAA